MKKILFVCDGENYSYGSFEFIKLIHLHEPVYVKGLFFPTMKKASLSYDSYAPGVYDELLESRQEAERKGIEQFINQCKTHNIQCLEVKKDAASWNKDFWEKETRYADLMVISQELLGANLNSLQPNTHMLELLRWADCPVLTVPETALPPEHIIGATDGSAESMHALTQFCKMFPQYSALPAKFVYVKNEHNKKYRIEDY